MSPATVKLREDTIDLHVLRHRRGCSERMTFLDVDTFEGEPSRPITLHKYLYGNSDPVGNIDPSGHFSIPSILVTTGINASLYAVGFGSIRFAFAKARGLTTAAAFQEGLSAAGWGALLAVPVVGHVLGGIGLYQTAKGLANGDFDEMDRLELAVNLAASLLLNRGGASLGRWATAPSVNAPPPGTKLALPQRMTLIFSRMKNEPPARTPQEAHATLSRIMKEVEDGYSGVAENPNPGLARDGRMYPPKADFIKESATGALIATSRGHKTIFHKDGGITIINRMTGKTDFHDGPSPMNPLYTNNGD